MGLNTNYLSARIINELMEIIGLELLEELVAESAAWGLMVDETTYISVRSSWGLWSDLFTFRVRAHIYSVCVVFFYIIINLSSVIPKAGRT